jgi:hypothetical protein
MVKWKELSDEQKANAVSNQVKATSKTLKDFASFIQTCRTKGQGKPMIWKRECIKRFQAGGSDRPNVSVADGAGNNEEIAPVERMSEPRRTRANGQVEEFTWIDNPLYEGAEKPNAAALLVKEFDLVETLCEGITITCNIVVVVCVSMDINEEIKKGHQSAGIIAMDIITVTVLSVQSLVGAVAIGMSSKSTSYSDYNDAFRIC